MSLLSGKQNTKKKLRGRRKKIEGSLNEIADVNTNTMESDSKSHEILNKESIDLKHIDLLEDMALDNGDNADNTDNTDNTDTSLTEELSEITDTSFDAAEFERRLQSQRTLAELELKVYKEGKSVSAMDLLRGRKEKQENVVKDAKLVEHIYQEEPEIVEVVVNNITDHILVEDDPIKLLELKFASKRTAARDLFSSFTPKAVKNSKGEWTLKVKLRLSPQKLAAVKQFENPLMAKGNTGPGPTGKSFLNTLMKTKPSYEVTFKLPKDFLLEIRRISNPLYTKSSGNQKGKPANSVFAMMMQSASQTALPKLTSIQRLKELYPPTIPKSSMHVCPPDQYSYSLERLRELPLKSERTPQIDISKELFDSLLEYKDTLNYAEIKTVISDELNLETIVERIPLASSNAAHKRILDDFIIKQTIIKNLNWPQRFQPANLETLLLSESSRTFIRDWIDNAFSVLSIQSTKTPRNVKLREQAKRQRKREANMSFIVDDDFEEEEETDEDIFVPVLIISGETGSCKTSSVYAALNALNGYVHEINSGQQRSRKDLYSSLKEFCTTQIIHQNLTVDGTTFQKGVVLFEDCDILFDQDKTFWTVVQDVVNFSKRPIVITVTDTSVIPRNIWDLAEEQNSIVNLLIPDSQSLQQYLWLCAYSCGYDLKIGLLKKIVDDCRVDTSYDLRKALMISQWLCCRLNAPEGKITELIYESPQPTKLTSIEDLKALADQLDNMSASDIIGENSTSKFLHDSHENELLDIYVVHDSMLTKQPSLQHELNIGKELQKMIHGDNDREMTLEFTHNKLRAIVLRFLSSRKKKPPRFLQNLQILRTQTRSRSSSEFVEDEPELQLLPDTSTCYSMSHYPFILDLAPFARLWCCFQKMIFAMDIKSMEKGENINLESFLDWRRFYHNVDEILETSPLKMT